MKKLSIIILFLFSFILLNGQEKRDSVKTGWNFGILPAIAFDSDLGMFYGIILNPFDYGNGSRYPDYCQQILIQVARYTGGSSEHYIEYDSYSIIPGLRFLSRIRYVRNQAWPFYGFNGKEAYYRQSWEDPDATDYRTKMFYRQDRRIFQVYANVLDTIGKSKLQWHAGWEMVNYNIDTVDIAKLNRNRDAGEKLPYETTLYEYYTDRWGIINDSERDGGLVNSFLLGLVFDSRNQLTNPSKGLYTELNLRWIPSFIGREHFSGLNLGFIHRHYVSLKQDRLVLAYRLWLNATIAGKPPYFTRQQLSTFLGSEGYGGFNTLRGVLMQRIVTRDFLLTNTELRARLVNFRMLKQNWYLGAVGFIDAGRILKPAWLDLSRLSAVEKSVYFSSRDKSIHASGGGGLKLVMNQNFVLSAEFGKAFDPQDGTSSLYMGLNYLF